MSRGRQSVDIGGQRFGRLVAIRMTVRSSWKPPRCPERWLFRCDCGNETEALKPDVMHNKTVSCGCLQAEVRIQNNKQRATHRHTTDGKRSPEWSSWRSMRKRCSDPNNKDWARYGARGITICDRWNDFENFLIDMGPRPSPEHEIDRIDNDGRYEPSNCRWATRVEQANNTSANCLLTIDGRAQTLAQWAREAGISPKRLRRYIVDRGISLELVAYYVRRKIDEARAA